MVTYKGQMAKYREWQIGQLKFPKKKKNCKLAHSGSKGDGDLKLWQT